MQFGGKSLTNTGGIIKDFIIINCHRGKQIRFGNSAYITVGMS